MSIAAAQWDDARNLRLATRLRAAEPRLEAMGMVREGVLRRAVGLTLEATGCEAPLGARCRVETRGGRWVEAEVVGFAGDRTFLMPTSDLSGLLPNARVITGSSRAEVAVGEGLLAGYRQIQGKELSYNNIADADAAWECVRSFQTGACVIVKHANPCGVALGANALAAYQQAFKTDPTSAFGGIIAFNTTVDETAAQAVSEQFLEVLIAPAYTGAALALLAAKKNVRVLEVPLGTTHNPYDVKRVGGGWLVQDPDNLSATEADVRVVTRLAPTAEQMRDLLFAWNVAQYVKSNAIVFCGQGMTLGVGAGQMSRIDSARIASIKAEKAGLTLTGSAVASDAFFPFRDGLDVVADAGATCVIQPGGSIRDDEVIAAADERGIAMVFTGTRHFRH